MPRHHRTKGIHDALVYLLFLAALVLGAVGLSQCRMVDDTVTGVDLNQSTEMGGKNRCIKECNEAFKDARRDEKRRHHKALRECERDHDGDGKKDGDDDDDKGKGDGDGKKGDEARDECRKAENELHRAILKQLESERRDCKSHCYNEGSGKGGR